MNSTTYNAQFLTIDFRLLDDPAFCKFMRSAAFPVYMLLRRYVWRGTKRKHPVDKVNELYRDGFLVAALPREMLAKKLELRNVASVSRHLAELEKLGVVRTVKTGRQNVYMLGTWEDRSLAHDGSYVIEIFLLEQRHGAELYDQPRRDDVAPGLSKTPEVTPTVTSEVTPTVTSDVAKKSHNNKEVNRETNREANRAGRRGSDILPGFPHLPIPEAIRIPFTDEARPPTPRRPPRPRDHVPRKSSGSRADLKLVHSDRELDYEPKYPVLTVRF